MLVKIRSNILVFLIFSITLPLMAETRMEELHKEIERQEQAHWQEQVNLTFTQLSNHFSDHEKKQMQMSENGIALAKLSPDQTTALHNLLSTALTPLGYLRATSLLGIQSIHREMGKSGNPGTLKLTRMDSTTLLILRSSTFSITLQSANDNWSIAYLFMGQWPRQVSDAPQPDLTLPDIQYPYIRWHEATGLSPLGQTARLAIRTLNELPDTIRKGACMGSSTSNMSCPFSSMNMDSSRSINLDDLSAKAQGLLTKLLMQLKQHMALTDTLELRDIKLSWAGEIPLLYHTGKNKDLLLNIASDKEQWQILLTGSTPTKNMDMLPTDAIMIRYWSDEPEDMSFQNLPQLKQNAPRSEEHQETEASSPEIGNKPDNSQSREIKPAGGDETAMQTNQDNKDDITWLKDPTFLNGLALSIGFEGKNISPQTPFTPVVRVEKNGRTHKNIRVTVTLKMEGSTPWLESLPLVFNPEHQDYRISVHLPASMSGGNLMIQFNVHEPGTRYEGMYEYTVKAGTGEVTQTPLF